MTVAVSVLPEVSDTWYVISVGSPVNVSSGVKVIAPVTGSTSHSPSPGTVNVVTGVPVAGSIISTVVGNHWLMESNVQQM